MRTSSGFDTLLERAAAALLLFAVAWATFWFGGVRNGEFFVSIAAVGLAFVCWAVRLWANRSNRFLLPPVVWAIPVFVGYAVWRHTRADIPYLSRMELMTLVTCAVAFFVSLHNLHRQETGGWFTSALITLGMLLGAYAVLQFMAQSSKVLWAERPDIYFKRYGGPFVNPNHLAGFLVLIMPLGLSNAFLGRSGAIVKILNGYAAVAMLGGIAVTMSRGGWLGAVIALGVFSAWLWRRPQFRIPVAALAVIVCAVGLIFISKSDKAKSRIQSAGVASHADSGSFRGWLWKPTLAMWSDNKAYGVGPGHYNSRFPAYRVAETQISPHHVHNEYLELLVDYGAAGASIVGAGLLLFAYGIWRTSKHVERGSSDLGMKNSNRTAFFAGAVAGLAGFAVHCFFEFNLHIPAIALLASILAAMVVSNTRFATERFWFSSNIATRLVATGVVAGTLFWLMPVAVAAGREDRHLQRAVESQTLDEAFFTELRAAAAIAPENPLTAFWYGEEKRRISWEGLKGWEEQAQEAVEWLQKSAQLDRFNANTRMTLGLCHQWLGNTNQAAMEFEAAAKLGPNDFKIENALAWNLMSRGEYDRAREAVKRSLEIRPWENWEAKSYEAKLNSLPAGR